MTRVLVDSDVIIANLRGDHRAFSLLKPLLEGGPQHEALRATRSPSLLGRSISAGI